MSWLLYLSAPSSLINLLMKLLVTSTDALIDKSTSDFFPGVQEALLEFKKLVPGNDVVVLSGHSGNLDVIPKELNPINIPIHRRGSPLVIETIMKTQPSFNDRGKIFILASNDADFRTAANSKVLLLGAGYSAKNNPGSSAFKYGIQVSSIAGLTQFFSRFSNINSPWYFKFDLGTTCTIYALINANTFGFSRSGDAFDISDKFQQCIKQGKVTYRDNFATYFLMSVYQIVNTVENVDIWAIYPSSSSSNNSDLEHFKDLARTAFNKRAKEPLFIRHAVAPKRHKSTKSNRIADGCDSQFSTMHINPYYKGKLEGKTICVIDDFTTFGSSSESTRILLEAAGVARVIFIALGKFGQEYYKFDYDISGDIFKPGFSFKKTSSISLVGSFNSYADKSMLESLKGIV